MRCCGIVLLYITTADQWHYRRSRKLLIIHLCWLRDLFIIFIFLVIFFFSFPTTGHFHIHFRRWINHTIKYSANINELRIGLICIRTQKYTMMMIFYIWRYWWCFSEDPMVQTYSSPFLMLWIEWIWPLVWTEDKRSFFHVCRAIKHLSINVFNIYALN